MNTTPQQPITSENEQKDKPKRFLNGWTKEQERLMSEWSDIAMCYRWIHDQSEKLFHKKTMYINLPVIVLSTLGGTANFGISSMFSDEDSKKYASFAIGGISLVAGLLTTIGNYLRFPQMEESHRVASISWGKLQRMIAIELSLHPNDRLDSLDFLKISRAELDRLIEQSPPIPQEAILKFEEKFGHIRDLKKPDICGALEHTMIFESSEERLKQLASDAELTLIHRKNALAELASQDEIKKHVAIEIEQAIEAHKDRLTQEAAKKKEEEEKAKEEFERVMEERKKKIQEEIDAEKKKLVAHQSPSIPVIRPIVEATMESRINRQRSSIPRPANLSRRGSLETITNQLVMNPLFDSSKPATNTQPLQHPTPPGPIQSKIVTTSPEDLAKYGDLTRGSDMTTQT